MNIQLIKGEFNSKNTLDIVTQMVHVKIKYHEGKIAKNGNEEDIKYRESKIKHLQKELFELRNALADKENDLKIVAEIAIN